MGVINFLMNPLPLSLVVNSYVAFLTPVLIYFTIFKKYDPNVKSKIPFFVKEIIFILLLGWIISSWLAMYSTLEQCGSVSMFLTLGIGLITPAFLILGLLMVRYLIPALKSPAPLSPAILILILLILI